jgi:hypothetical protein
MRDQGRMMQAAGSPAPLPNQSEERRRSSPTNCCFVRCEGMSRALAMGSRPHVSRKVVSGIDQGDV